MVTPEGFEPMEIQSARLLGEVSGKVDGLIQEFRDEREEARKERRILFEKVGQLDLIISRLDAVEHKHDSLKLQVMSNKAQIDKANAERETEKSINVHTMKLVGFFGTIFTAIGTTLWMFGSWVEGKFHVLSAIFWTKP